MTLDEIKTAIAKRQSVYWSNEAYIVYQDRIGQYLIEHLNGSCIGLTHLDGVTLNGNESDFFIA